jgi:hypothetical protein
MQSPRRNAHTHTHTHTHTSEHNKTAPWSLNLQKTCIHHVMKTEIIGQGGRGRWNRVTNEVTPASISWLIICGPRPRQRAWQTRFGATENQIRGGHEKQDSGRSLKTRFGEGMENNIPGGHGKPDSRFGEVMENQIRKRGQGKPDPGRSILHDWKIIYLLLSNGGRRLKKCFWGRRLKKYFLGRVEITRQY